MAAEPDLGMGMEGSETKRRSCLTPPALLEYIPMSAKRRCRVILVANGQDIKETS
jgi:hypothetical protein